MLYNTDYFMFKSIIFGFVSCYIILIILCLNLLYLDLCCCVSYRGCLVYVFKQQFSVFKQHFTHFNALFHPHVFPQMFLNNNFQFLNTHTKRAHRYFVLIVLFLFLDQINGVVIIVLPLDIF